MVLITTEFEQFWANYPRHVGKLAAQKAYRKARTVASAAEILDGVERYKQNKPRYADWAHPTTFLNQGRWLDEPDSAPAARRQQAIPIEPSEKPGSVSAWMAECQRLHGGTCGGSLGKHLERLRGQQRHAS